jgi:uncharacterized protein (TIGR02996 family)
MDEEVALWQAVHDNPADEGPWLVLADWLEEHDDPLRAELFRVTLTLRLCSTKGREAALEQRQRELLAAGVLPAVPELVNSIGMRFVLIPPGTFWMGSPEEEGREEREGPLHEVEISRPFYLGAGTVTQEQYQRVIGSNPSWFHAGGGGKNDVVGLDTSNFPVEEVSWEDAVAFCQKLSALPEEKKAGRLYRLPTEAEWEYSCRGGASSSTPFHVGASLSPTQANFDETSLGRPCPVGSYPANAFGLYDMHGNVWEWCSDWDGEGYHAASPRCDPTGPSGGAFRVYRGGGWISFSGACRSACRGALDTAHRDRSTGFRVALILSGG